MALVPQSGFVFVPFYSLFLTGHLCRARLRYWECLCGPPGAYYTFTMGKNALTYLASE